LTGGWPTLPRHRSERLVFPGAASSPSCGGQAAGEGAGLDADRAGGPPALGTEMSRGMVPVPPMSGYGVYQDLAISEGTRTVGVHAILGYSVFLLRFMMPTTRVLEGVNR